MADIKKARSTFLELIEDLDPDVECVIPPKPSQGNYLIELSRADGKQVVKVSEKELLAIEDEGVRQKVEERVLTAIEKLPDASGDEDEEEDEDFDEDFDEEELDEDEDEEEEEEEEDDEE